ncbi:DUF2493 domain-containing protein [Massilia oculi]|uniref:YspA cpYpsA-related SLOG domain-containing protein n=1 Tax=Massilia oculi TaxID=945844 RepID=A0A2S2DDG9_9BURK|nr:DUF2493 domain-containing protein [Massilia oculi]AWL03387.1 hypothetical protein DIR46_02250 [Massilia oculi]
MKLLVCGGRDFKNVSRVRHVLHAIHAKRAVTLLIEGGAAGADRLAREWAVENGIPVQTFQADWKAHGKAAGPIRNGRMINEGKPDGVCAFPGGRGTANMVEQALEAGIKVMEVAA